MTRFTFILLGMMEMTASLRAELTVASCAPERVYYEPGETVKVSVVVKNPGTDTVSRQLRVSIIHELNQREELLKQAVSLESREVLNKSLAWTPKQELWGCDVVAELLDAGGQPVARRSETFAVHHTPFAVGQHMGCLGAMNHPQQGLVANLGGFRWSTEELMRTARRYYTTSCEQFAWAPSDFSSLAPKEETWFAGQAFYAQSKEGVREVIRQGHRHGIRALTYACILESGVAGLEFARCHPEWIQRTDLGQFVGRYDQSFFEVEIPRLAFDESAPQRAALFSHHVQVDVYDPAGVEYGTRELARSAEMFGWDGVRFDGHWTLDGISFDNQVTYGYDGSPQAHGQDPDMLSLRNMQAGIDLIRKRCPKFLLSYNYGFEYEGMGARLPKTFAFCARDAAIVWESSREMAREGTPYHTWEAALDAFRRETEITRKAGGYEYIISPEGGPVSFSTGFARHYYPSLYSSGAHLFGIAFSDPASVKYYAVSTEGAVPIHRFAMRYSHFLYDLAIRHGLPAGCEVNLSGGGLWRSNLITTQPGEGKNERIIVCQILGRPAGEVIDLKNPSSPSPVTKTRVSLKIPEAMKLLSAAWVAPEKEPVPVEFKPQDTALVAELPDTSYWSILVIRVLKSG